MTADYMPSGELRLDDPNGVRHSCRTLGEGGTRGMGETHQSANVGSQRNGIRLKLVRVG